MFEQFCSLPLSSFLSFSAISSFCTSAAAFTVAACIVLWVHILIIVVSGALFWFGVRPMLKLVGLAERDPSATHYTKDNLAHRRLSASASSRDYAYDKTHPNGSPGGREDYTCVQKHVAYFDEDDDGRIYPLDTYKSFRRIGFGRAFSALAVVLIHSSMSFPTWPSWWPQPRLPIHVSRMHRTRHGSDSGTLDAEGRFNGPRFEELFSKYATAEVDGEPALSRSDISDLLYANVSVNDPNGIVTARFEWLPFWWIARDDDGLLSKETVRSMYDGGLWMRLEEQATRRRGYEVWPRTPRPKPAKAGKPTAAERKGAEDEVEPDASRPSTPESMKRRSAEEMKQKSV